MDSYRKFTAIPKPVIKPFSALELVEQAVNLHTHLAADKNINIRVFALEDIALNADKNLIIQVLVNLIKNAIEAANENGEIHIDITCTLDEVQSIRQDYEKIVIDIANTGQPIPQDVLSFIFIPFFTTKETGSGVGLSVSRYIMRLHGGNLLHSVSPKGMTVFSMVF